MKNTITIILCSMFLLLASPVFAKEKLAVMDLEATFGVDEGMAYALSDVLRDGIQAQGEYEVLSKEDLDAIARRLSLQQQAGECTDDKCLADFGKALGTKYMVHGSISKLGSTYSISLRLLDTEGQEAGVKKRVNERCKCNEDELFDTVLIAAAKIMGKEPKTPDQSTKPVQSDNAKNERRLEEQATSLSPKMADKQNSGKLVSSHLAAFEKFPKRYYTVFSQYFYEPCLNCHTNILKSRISSEDTDFRNGKHNLHYLHVQRKKGQTCIACHDITPEGELIFRKEIPFGAWSYPIKVTINDIGATCVVGCHAPKTYARE